jgi:AmmeMemoRadiSam system protein B
MIEDTGKTKLREATVAGIFYPEDPEELRSRVSSLLAEASPALSCAHAIVSPHAGLDYSGDLAALAWKSASGLDIRTVVILSPFHRAEESLVYLPESDSYDTPLGPVPVDRALVEELRDCGTAFVVNDIPHFEEHGIEVQLPFMRLLFPEARLVPIVIGKPSYAMAKSLGSALDLVFSQRANTTLIVLSTSLVSGPDSNSVASLTDDLLRVLEKGDPKVVLDAGLCSEGPVCGVCGLAAYLASPLSAGTRFQVLGRHDSSRSRQSGDERLVEYIAAAFIPADDDIGAGT